MKKYFAIALASAMAITVLAGCGGNGGNGENTAPEINGVKATLTVEAGSEIDLLEGITATDAEDGDLTNKIEVSTMPALTVSDGKVTPEQAGSYEVTYSVTDSAKETTEEYTSLAVTRHAGPATEYQSFDFSTKAGEANGWEHSVGESAEGTTAALKEGSYVFDIKNPGNGDGDVKLAKTIDLEDADYKVKVWAKSTKETYAHLLAKKADEQDWATYGGTYNAVIGPSVSSFELTFHGEAEKHAELLIHLGKITPNPDNAEDTTPSDFTVTIDKVEIYKITGTETESQLVSYDFANNTDGVDVSNDPSVTGVSATHDNGTLKIEIGQYPTESEDWRVKAKIALSDVTIEADKKYYYSFKIKGTNALDMNVCVESKEKEWQNRACFSSPTAAANEEKTIEGTFTPGGDMKEPITDAVLCIYLGKHAADVTSNVVVIDDVKFGELTGDKNTEKTIDNFMAKFNPDEDAAVKFYLFNGTDEDNEKGVGTMWMEGGKLYYRIDQGASTDWHNKLTINLDLPSDCYFTIKFKAKASKAVDCPMFLNSGAWAPRLTETVHFTTEEQEFTFSTTETLVVEMNFDILFQFGSAALTELGEVTIEFSDFQILMSEVS